MYEVLDITPDATTTEIKEAFFRKAKVFHPDVDSSVKARQEFLKSKEAYQILSNTLERHEYDKLILGKILSFLKLFLSGMIVTFNKEILFDIFF